jgi:hypothetical protein
LSQKQLQSRVITASSKQATAGGPVEAAMMQLYISIEEPL